MSTVRRKPKLTGLKLIHHQNYDCTLTLQCITPTSITLIPLPFSVAMQCGQWKMLHCMVPLQWQMYLKECRGNKLMLKWKRIFKLHVRQEQSTIILLCRTLPGISSFFSRRSSPLHTLVPPPSIVSLSPFLLKVVEFNHPLLKFFRGWAFMSKDHSVQPW